MREALEHIVEYWNRDQNENAMADALHHIIETAEEALAQQPDAGVELTDAEIWSLDEMGNEPSMEDVAAFARTVIAAHEAKKAGGGLELLAQDDGGLTEADLIGGEA